MTGETPLAAVPYDGLRGSKPTPADSAGLQESDASPKAPAPKAPRASDPGDHGASGELLRPMTVFALRSRLEQST